MAVKITRYIASDEGRWDNFVHTSNNGTLFHLRQFLAYHPEGRFADHSLLFSGSKGIIGLLPAAEVEKGGRRWLISHPGATFGGLVTPIGLTFQQSDDLVQLLVDHARAADFAGITLTLSPTIYNRRLSNYIDSGLLRHGFAYEQKEVSSILFLESSIDLNLAKFSDASRRALRKAEASDVVVRKSADLSTYYDLLLHNLETRHHVQPTHTLAELQRLADLFSHEISLLAAFKDDRMIAGIVTFDANKEVVLAYYIAHDENFQQYRAVNLLFHYLIDQAISDGFRYLDFGIFTIGGEPNRGLARFKESFGASGMFRDRLTISF